MNDTIALLLCDPPLLRYRVLTELLEVPADDPEAADLAGRRHWPDELHAPGAADRDDLKALTWSLCRLAYLGFDRTDPGVRPQELDPSWCTIPTSNRAVELTASLSSDTRPGWGNSRVPWRHDDAHLRRRV